MSHLRSRFQKAAEESVIKYTSSLPFDWRLYPYDIRGSIAHARMLGRQAIISDDEAAALEQGLESVGAEIIAGRFVFKPELEDIHIAIEARLFELAGSVAGKLHTARSRNDQIALDMRLYVKQMAADTQASIRELQKALVSKADDHRAVVMPGYTHLQLAQPVLLAHHLLAYYEMLERDFSRFQDCARHADSMPLGSGALAGSPYKLDREMVAHELGFTRISQNSMDAVADRDFVIDYLSAAAVCMMHLSRLAEELVIWSTSEFGFVELDDAYTTGSSIMPQKKNPDVAELGRGKTGRVYGNLMSMLTTMKALPLTYNRDMQEDKEALFDTGDTLLLSLEVFGGMVKTAVFKPRTMGRALANDIILATDMADYLVKKGLSFREAHGVMGKLVSHAVGTGRALKSLSLEEFQGFSPLFSDDVFKIDVASSVGSRNVPGGTSRAQIARQLRRARHSLKM
jgi:argininosuccinate lyase